MPLTQNVVDHFKTQGITLEPWCYLRHGDDGRDSSRFAWVTLNAVSPLTENVPLLKDRSDVRLGTGELRDWEWSCRPDYYISKRPWRAYIPVFSQARERHYSWLFATPILLGVPVPRSVNLKLDPRLKDAVRKTCHVVMTLCAVVGEAYNLKDSYCPPPVDNSWLEQEFRALPSLAAKFWDSRRAVLERLGFLTYQLIRHDAKLFHPRVWPKDFTEEVEKLVILSGPRRGLIVRVEEIQLSELELYIRDQVPIHYQWSFTSSKVKATDPFNPNSFRTYDWAAYLQAGGEYAKDGKERSVLGTDSALALSRAVRLRRSLFDLPEPPRFRPGMHKAKRRVFCRSKEGSPLTEITHLPSTIRQLDEDCSKTFRKHPSGDMVLYTKDRGDNNSESDDKLMRDYLYPTPSRTFIRPVHIPTSPQAPAATLSFQSSTPQPAVGSVAHGPSSPAPQSAAVLAVPSMHGHLASAVSYVNCSTIAHYVPVIEGSGSHPWCTGGQSHRHG